MKALLIATGFALLSSVGFAMPKGAELDYYQTSPFRTITHKAFKAGEVLHFKMNFGVINAGVGNVKVLNTNKKVKGRELLHIKAEGKSIPAFDLFYKVRDKFETYIDKKGVFPWIFMRRVNEGGFKFSQDYTFFQHKKIVDNGKGKEKDVPNMVQDMVSAVYYTRTIDFSDAKIDQVYSIKSFVDDEIHDLKIKYKGKETIKIRSGKYDCLKFQPVVIEGRIFKESDDLQVWVSADQNHVPVLVKADVWLGSIKMELSDYSGLANPIAKVEED